MATKKSEANEPETQAGEEFADCYGGDAPEGFKEAGQPDIDGWWKAEEGLVFQGQIITSFTIEDGASERDVVCVRLSRATKAMAGRGDNAKAVKLDKGMVLGVGVSYKLQPMLEYVEHQGFVWCKAEKKVSIDKGRSMQNYDLRIKGQRSTPVKASPAADAGAPF